MRVCGVVWAGAAGGWNRAMVDGYPRTGWYEAEQKKKGKSVVHLACLPACLPGGRGAARPRERSEAPSRELD